VVALTASATVNFKVAGKLSQFNLLSLRSGGAMTRRARHATCAAWRRRFVVGVVTASAISLLLFLPTFLEHDAVSRYFYADSNSTLVWALPHQEQARRRKIDMWQRSRLTISTR